MGPDPALKKRGSMAAPPVEMTGEEGETPSAPDTSESSSASELLERAEDPEPLKPGSAPGLDALPVSECEQLQALSASLQALYQAYADSLEDETLQQLLIEQAQAEGALPALALALRKLPLSETQRSALVTRLALSMSAELMPAHKRRSPRKIGKLFALSAALLSLTLFALLVSHILRRYQRILEASW